MQKLTLLILVFLTSSIMAQNPNLHIYICFGQSNMEGAAAIEEQDKTVNERLLTYQSVDCDNLNFAKGQWRPGIPPLCNCYQGLSPADYFGRTMVKNMPKNIKIGLIGVAIGGCDIRLFDKDLYEAYDSTYNAEWFYQKVNAYSGNPYKHLMTLAKEAQKDGVIKGILLHQGETNEGDAQWPEYVKKVYNNMLEELSLKAEDVPLLAGEVANEDMNGKCASMNPIINTLPKVIPTAHVISSSKCEVKDDYVHFNSAGVRELGKRYAETMLEILE